MIKKEYIPMLAYAHNKPKSNVEHRHISKRDEERIKNMIREQPKVREMLNKNLQYRDDFLRSQKLINYKMEKSRLMAIENEVIGNLRYVVRGDNFRKSLDRMQQVDELINDEVISQRHYGPDYFPHRFY